LTEFNSEVNVRYVDDLFKKEGLRTRVYISGDAAEFLAKCARKHAPEIKRMLAKVEYYATNGFVTFEGSDLPIRDEGHGVYRIAHSRGSLFRLIGFYENDDKGVFFVVDGFLKKGQDLSRPQRDRIANVGREKKSWRRRD